MAPEELLFDIDQLRIKYKGQKFAIDEPIPYIEESCELINQFKKEVESEVIKRLDELDYIDIDYLIKTKQQ